MPGASAASLLVGAWFGTGQPDDKSAMYLDHMLSNGEIHSDFRTCRKGKAFDSHEDGTWSVAGNILTVSVISHDGQFMPRADAYKIVALDAHNYREIYQRLNFAYAPRRVDDKFTLPSCEMVS